MAKLDDAIAQYLQAIAAEPRYALPYNNLGLALLHLDRISDAIDKYRIAIRIAPNYLLARWNLCAERERLKKEQLSPMKCKVLGGQILR